MNKFFFLFLFFILGKLNVAEAQSSKHSQYNTAIGFKFYPGGVTFKQALNKSKCLEVNGYFWKGIRITGLYELHYDIAGVDGLRWYVGPGLHTSMYSPDINENYAGRNYIGIDGVLGLDYKIPSVPLNLSLDWQPSIEFGTSPGFVGGYGGLSVRYVIL